MNSYQISDLVRLTGINAHTLRIWERRYKIIEPHRTSTNIRFYDDEQVVKLLKISTLLNQGMKISKISELSEKQLNSRVNELEKIAPEDAVCSALINNLTASMLTFDEPAFEKVFSSAILRFGLYEAMIKVFYPFLKQTGLMWTYNEAMPVQEHFATAIIRRKLIVAIDGLPETTKKGKKFLLFLASDEWHETSLLLSDYIIRSSGFKTVYLSQNVPLQNLKEVIANTKPTHLLTLYIARQNMEKIHAEMYDVAMAHKNCEVLIGGTAAILKSVKKAKNITLLNSPVDLINLLNH